MCSLNEGRCIIYSQLGQCPGLTFNNEAMIEFKSVEYFLGIFG